MQLFFSGGYIKSSSPRMLVLNLPTGGNRMDYETGLLAMQCVAKPERSDFVQFIKTKCFKPSPLWEEPWLELDPWQTSLEMNLDSRRRKSNPLSIAEPVIKTLPEEPCSLSIPHFATDIEMRLKNESDRYVPPAKSVTRSPQSNVPKAPHKPALKNTIRPVSTKKPQVRFLLLTAELSSAYHNALRGKEPHVKQGLTLVYSKLADSGRFLHD